MNGSQLIRRYLPPTNPTSVERRLRQKARSKEQGAVLVPLIEQLLEQEVIPEDDQDLLFLDHLWRRRMQKRERNVFSPSMLGSCIRRSYFSKIGEEKHTVTSPRTNGYFLQGNFAHVKWQFALHKARRKGLLEMVNDGLPFPAASGFEVRVYSHASDFAGTIDAIPIINGEHYIVDFKGINLQDFQQAVRHGVKDEYKIQIVGYAMIVNGHSQFSFVAKKCLMILEAKPGPISGGNPIALHEQCIPVDDHKDEVRRRLNELRKYEKDREIPPPACVSTRHMMFQECPFSRFCKTEVLAVQKSIEQSKSSPKLRVARP